MITYVDTSCLLKLLIDEDGSERAGEIWDVAYDLAAVPLVLVEARAALAAAQRASRLTAAEHIRAKGELEALVDQLAVVELTAELIVHAADLAEAEALRGYDAVHLAGAVFVGASVLASADVVLGGAAERNGLAVANPLDP